MLVALPSADNFRSLRGCWIYPWRQGHSDHRSERRWQDQFIEGSLLRSYWQIFRTADRRDLIPFGESYARVRVKVDSEPGISHEFFSFTSRSEGARFAMDGANIDRVQAAVTGHDHRFFSRPPGNSQGASVNQARPPRRIHRGALAIEIGGPQEVWTRSRAKERPPCPDPEGPRQFFGVVPLGPTGS